MTPSRPDADVLTERLRMLDATLAELALLQDVDAGLPHRDESRSPLT